MTAVYHMTYLQAVVIGLLQGLTELFPISSLGHTVLVPAWLGGTWATLVRQESRAESPYLAFIVSLHLATAAVLIGFYWRTWLRVGRGLVTSIARRQIDSPDQRLAWLLIIATIPVGIAGLLGEHTFRVLFAKPEAAAIFLTVNGGILLLGERYRRRGTEPSVDGAVRRPAPSTPLAAGPTAPAGGAAPIAEPTAPSSGPMPTAQLADPGLAEHEPTDLAAEHRLARVGAVSALWIGTAQILALLAGISREGVTMAGGLLRGLSHEDALRFSFLLSTPVILAAGLLKVPDLLGPLGDGIRGQALAGGFAAAVASLFAVLFLARYFKTRTLLPFAVYCVAAGLISVVRFAVG